MQRATGPRACRTPTPRGVGVAFPFRVLAPFPSITGTSTPSTTSLASKQAHMTRCISCSFRMPRPGVPDVEKSSGYGDASSVGHPLQRPPDIQDRTPRALASRHTTSPLLRAHAPTRMRLTTPPHLTPPQQWHRPSSAPPPTYLPSLDRGSLPRSLANCSQALAPPSNRIL